MGEGGEAGRLAERLALGLATIGINQAELARRAGLTRAYVGRLLAGAQAAPTPGVLGQLATALELDAAGRLQLFAAAGQLPPAVADQLLASPAATHLLTALVALSPAQRAAFERLLQAGLDLATDRAGSADQQ